MRRTPFPDQPRGSRPLAGFQGSGSCPRRRNPGWKRSGRQAVLAARTAPPRQDWRTSLRSQPGGHRNLRHPRVRTPGALECRDRPSEVPGLSRPGNLHGSGDNASYPTGKPNGEDTEASPPPPTEGYYPPQGVGPTPKAGLGQKKKHHLPWSDPEPRAGYSPQVQGRGKSQRASLIR